MTSIENLRRAAKALKKAHRAGEDDAKARVARVLKNTSDKLSHAEALHVLAAENGFDSWPKLKFAVESRDLARDELLERLPLLSAGLFSSRKSLRHFHTG